MNSKLQKQNSGYGKCDVNAEIEGIEMDNFVSMAGAERFGDDENAYERTKPDHGIEKSVHFQIID